MGQDATPVNEWRYSNDRLTTVFSKAEAMARGPSEMQSVGLRAIAPRVTGLMRPCDQSSGLLIRGRRGGPLPFPRHPDWGVASRDEAVLPINVLISTAPPGGGPPP